MRFLHSLALATALTVPGLLLAGNVPQYTIKRVYTTDDPAPLGEGWSLFDDGTIITERNRQNFVPANFIFADGTEAVNGYRGPGFPIGFDFRLGGNIVDQFAVSSNGMLQLGKGEVDYRGGNINLVMNANGMATNAPFQVCMAPIMGGAFKGTISYKTVGEEGNRICIVQWQTMILNETSAVVDTQRAKFSLQMRLYEADGKLEMAFIGEQSPMTGNGFFTGIHGWDNYDQLVVASNPREGQPASISSPVIAKDLHNVGILERGTYITWSMEDDDDESFVLTFYPAPDTPAPANAPVDLTVRQKGADILVSCKKAEGADATMIVYSNSPFTDADLPVNGVSYRVYDNNGDFITHIGNSTVIYYQNDEDIEVTIPNVEANGNYYVRAYSVNGYPNYNTENFAEYTAMTTQLPPAGFFSETREEGINLHWSSDYPVVIAVSTRMPLEYLDSYQGVFGQPEASVSVGDEIPGGGKVVYVGDGSECLIPNEMLKPNFPNMFRIWNVKDGVISSTANNSYGIPELTLPYEPEVETWPFALLPAGWQTSNENYGWTPRYRDGDRAQSLNGTFASSEQAGYPVSLTLTTPELPFTDGAATLEFEWALETVKDPAPADPDNPTGPMLAQGSEPGWFGEVPGGDPGLHISVGPMGMTQVVKTFDKYEGTMERFHDQGYIDGSSTWIQEKVDLGNLKGLNVISFTGSCQKNTICYLRRIKVSQENVAVAEIMPVADGLTAAGVKGALSLLSDKAMDVVVYNMFGVRVAEVTLVASEAATIDLPAGIYIVGGIKVVVK